VVRPIRFIWWLIGRLVSGIVHSYWRVVHPVNIYIVSNIITPTFRNIYYVTQPTFSWMNACIKCLFHSYGILHSNIQVYFSSGGLMRRITLTDTVVNMRSHSPYSLVVSNRSTIRMVINMSINGRSIGKYLLEPSETYNISRPVDDNHQFVFVPNAQQQTEVILIISSIITKQQAEIEYLRKKKKQQRKEAQQKKTTTTKPTRQQPTRTPTHLRRLVTRCPFSRIRTLFPNNHRNRSSLHLCFNHFKIHLIFQNKHLVISQRPITPTKQFPLTHTQLQEKTPQKNCAYLI